MPPSKKNHHFPLKNGGLGIDKEIKERMKQLENDILSQLYSECQIIEGETHSECWKRLRTLLSGLLDDSINEIPKGGWDVQRVESIEQSGIDIIIEEISMKNSTTRKVTK